MSTKEEEDIKRSPPGPRTRKLHTVLETALQTYLGSLKLETFLEAFPHRSAESDAILKEGFETFKQDIATNTRVDTHY